MSHVTVLHLPAKLRSFRCLIIVKTMQNDDGQLVNPPYLFQRMTTVATDTLMMSGRGPPNKVTGLTRSLFRPSDDAVTFPLNIPGMHNLKLLFF